jgi:hypothetical protein
MNVHGRCRIKVWNKLGVNGSDHQYMIICLRECSWEIISTPEERMEQGAKWKNGRQ